MVLPLSAAERGRGRGPSVPEAHIRDQRGREPDTFDRQAPGFDRRAGLPAAASLEVAAFVVSRLSTGTSPGRLLDLGAGTGEIGAELCRLLPAGGYLALDRSFGMLRVFGAKALRDKLSAVPSATPTRILADASRAWPLKDAAASAIFCSRAAHRIDRAAFLAETRRVLEPGGRLFLGSLARSENSVRAAMQRRMRSLLAEVLGEERGGEGFGRDSRRRHERLAAELGGASERVVASAFEVMEKPADSLAGWRSKAGLAGLDLEAREQEEALGRLEEWARAEYGDLNRPVPAIERYELLIVRPGAAEGKNL